MEAPLVRRYLEALPQLPPDARTLERVRFCLSTLQSPDVRYLVAAVLGADAAGIARVAAAVLRAAGARTATLGRTLEETTVDGLPIDDPLLARAGTMSAASGYQLADARRDLGELTRREGEVILALTAFAEASQRVALVLDPDVAPDDASHAPVPDLVVIGDVDAAAAERALGLVPPGRPVVAAGGAASELIERSAEKAGIPLLLGGRDHRVEEREGRSVLIVRDEPYVTFAVPGGIGTSEVASGIAAALALGVLGIRMREEWVVAGLDALRGEAVAS